MNMDEANLIADSPPKIKRRRSSFFERRQSIIPTIPPPEILNSADSPVIASADDVDAKLQIYLDSLQKERKDWRTTYGRRKAKYTDLKLMLNKSEPKQLPSLSSLQTRLLKEDWDFLRGKPMGAEGKTFDSLVKEACRETMQALQLQAEVFAAQKRIDTEVSQLTRSLETHILDYSLVDWPMILP